MRLKDLCEETIWEGEIDGEQYIIQSIPLLEANARQIKFTNNPSGKLSKVGQSALTTISKHPGLAGVAAGMAMGALSAYRQNRRFTTRFYAKGSKEIKFYQHIVTDLMATKQYRQVRKKRIDGGVLWELQRKGGV